MKIARSVKKFVKPHVDIPKWVALDDMSDSITNVVDLGKTLFIPQKATFQETFEEALVRLNLTEADVAKREKEFIRLQFIFGGFALLVFAYCVYLLLESNFVCAVICFALISIILSQVFRYNFWAFQIRKRKLGCTFQEWLFHFYKRP